MAFPQLASSVANSQRSSAAAAGHEAALLKAHSVALLRQEDRLKKAMAAADDELDKMIDNFISQQGESEDHCSSQLVQAKQELHSLHKHTTEVVVEVHKLEEDISNETQHLSYMYETEAETLEWEEAQLATCQQESEEDTAMYSLLKEELLELMLIANSSVSITSEQWNSYKMNMTERVENYSTVNITVSNYTMTFSCLPSTGDFNCTGPAAYCEEKRVICDTIHHNHTNLRQYECDMSSAAFQCIGDDTWCNERHLECQEDFDLYLETEGVKTFKCDLSQGYFNFTCQGDTAWCNYHEDHCREMYQAGGTGWASSDSNYDGNTGYMGDTCSDDAFICDSNALTFQCVNGCCWEHFDRLSERCAEMLGLVSSSLLEVGTKVWPKTPPRHAVSLAHKQGHGGAGVKERFAARAKSASKLAHLVQYRADRLRKCLARHPQKDFKPAQTAMMQLGVMARAHGKFGYAGSQGPATSGLALVDAGAGTSLGFCSDGIEVSIGGKSGTVVLNRTLTMGEFSTFPCSEVNPEFSGIIVATCAADTQPVALDISSCLRMAHGNVTEVCNRHIDALHEVYIKAYVEITRLLAYYSQYNASEACVSAVQTEFTGKETPVAQAVVVSRQDISTETSKLEAYKIELEAISSAELKLRNHIKMLEMKCSAMHTTISSLDQVRDAIIVLGMCPTIGEAAFYVPNYVCMLAPRPVDLHRQTDEEIDNLLDGFCKSECSSDSRLAEVAEIQEQTIEGMPSSNTGLVPVLAGCPYCAGLPDEAETEPKHTSGHRRNCWESQAPFTRDAMYNGCSGNTMKTAMCVADHGGDHPDSLGQPTQVDETTVLEHSSLIALGHGVLEPPTLSH